jgi:hypothetical protein
MERCRKSTDMDWKTSTGMARKPDYREPIQ